MNEDYGNAQIAITTVTIEMIGRVIKGMYSYKRPASYKDLAKPLGIHESTISMALSSSKELGLVDPASKRGVYIITDVGENFARLLSFGKEEECRLIIKNQILGLPQWENIVLFLVMNKGTARDALDLVLHVETRLGKHWKDRMRGRVANSFKSILEYANLINLENSLIVPLDIENRLQSSNESKEVSSIAKDPLESLHTSPTSYSASISKTRDTPEYAEFSLPDFFIIFVRKSPGAIAYFREQIQDESIFSSWLNIIENDLNETELDEE